MATREMKIWKEVQQPYSLNGLTGAWGLGPTIPLRSPLPEAADELLNELHLHLVIHPLPLGG